MASGTGTENLPDAEVGYSSHLASPVCQCRQFPLAGSTTFAAFAGARPFAECNPSLPARNRDMPFTPTLAERQKPLLANCFRYGEERRNRLSNEQTRVETGVQALEPVPVGESRTSDAISGAENARSFLQFHCRDDSARPSRREAIPGGMARAPLIRLDRSFRIRTSRGHHPPSFELQGQNRIPGLFHRGSSRLGRSRGPTFCEKRFAGDTHFLRASVRFATSTDGKDPHREPSTNFPI